MNTNKEYPKSFIVPFLPMDADSSTDVIMACYAFVLTSTFHPQLLVNNAHPSEANPGEVFSWDSFALAISDEYPLDYPQFYEIYLQHKSGMSGVTALDCTDTQKVTLLLPPEQAAKEADIPLCPIVEIYDRKTEAGLYSFFRDWEDCYLKLKKEQNNN